MPRDGDLTRTVGKGLTDAGQHTIKTRTKVRAATHKSALVSEADLDLVVDTLNIHLSVGNFCRQSAANLLVFTLRDILTLLRIGAFRAVEGLLLCSGRPQHLHLGHNLGLCLRDLGK